MSDHHENSWVSTHDDNHIPQISHLLELHPGEAAELLADVSLLSQRELLLKLPPERAAQILDHLPSDLAVAATGTMSAARAASIIQEMKTDEEVDLLQCLDEDRRTAILAEVDESDASIARRLLSYGKNTAGGLMQAEFISVAATALAKDVVEQLRENAQRYAHLPASYLYTTNSTGELEGVVSTRSLVMCDAKTPVADIQSREVASVPPTLSGSELVRLFQRYRYVALPVVDDRNRLLGIVTENDALQFAERDADQEMLRFTGISTGDEFRSMPFALRSQRRLAWLSINVVLNVLAASFIALYEDTLRTAIMLAVFLPIISDMSGCSGNQAVAVSIREQSLGRLRSRTLFWVLGKELSIGIVNGLALGLLIGSIAYFWKGSLILGLVVGLALWINTILAVSIGGIVPLVLKRLKLDPALASSPILTTLTDSSGFLITLSLATYFLEYFP